MKKVRIRKQGLGIHKTSKDEVDVKEAEDLTTLRKPKTSNTTNLTIEEVNEIYKVNAD